MKKKILITGSTQGIGKAMAVAFVREGYDVIVHCTSNLEKAERIKTEIGAWKAVTADFSKPEEVKELVTKTGAVDCLVLNASVQNKQREERFRWKAHPNNPKSASKVRNYSWKNWRDMPPASNRIRDIHASLAR